MARRKGSKAWWAEQMAEFHRRRSEVTIRGFAEEIGVPFGTFHYQLYGKPKSRRGKQSKRAVALETRLVAVDVIGLAEKSEQADRRWLEAETPRGIRVRFLEGTGSEYVADLMTRIAARGA